ncbi:MAG: DUF4974 domain-containing protein [Pedobacter sp.]|nr:MAG: DUF4974 domain-containing protein [Pedobacter sp.]
MFYMEERYLNLLDKHAVNNLTTAEREELLNWVGDDPERSALLNDYKDILNANVRYVEEPVIDTDAAWLRMRYRINTDKQPLVKKLAFKQILARAAILAVLITGALFAYLQYSAPSELIVAADTGAPKDIVLPDGTKIHLAASSKLRYSRSFNKEGVREVVLDGEAFFDVKRDTLHPFIIETGYTKTQVLGTSFNVSAKAGRPVKVTVVTGKVSFMETGKIKNKVILTPGQSGTIIKGRDVQLTATNTTNFLFFKTGSLVFDDTPVSQVIDDILYAYNVQIAVKDSSVLKQHITASFKNQSIQEVKSVLEVLLNVKITGSGPVYFIERTN